MQSGSLDISQGDEMGNGSSTRGICLKGTSFGVDLGAVFLNGANFSCWLGVWDCREKGHLGVSPNRDQSPGNVVLFVSLTNPTKRVTSHFQKPHVSQTSFHFGAETNFGLPK